MRETDDSRSYDFYMNKNKIEERKENIKERKNKSKEWRVMNKNRDREGRRARTWKKRQQKLL